jgi:hypothetical protein
MNLFKKHKKEIRGWKDIKLTQLQQLNSLPNEGDEIELMVNQLAVLLNKTNDEIENTPVDNLLAEFKLWGFLKDLPEQKRVDIIEINGRKYGLCDFSKITLAQLIDGEAYFEAGLMQNMHKLFGVIYLPITKYSMITKKYELEEYSPNEERDNDFLDVTMDKLYPTMLFFYHIVKTYLIGSQTSLVEHMEMEMKKMMKTNGMEMPMEMKEEIQLLTQKIDKLKKLRNVGAGMK